MSSWIGEDPGMSSCIMEEAGDVVLYYSTIVRRCHLRLLKNPYDVWINEDVVFLIDYLYQ